MVLLSNFSSYKLPYFVFQNVVFVSYPPTNDFYVQYMSHH